MVKLIPEGFDLPPKGRSEDALMKWREAVGKLVKNRRRRFRYTADLDKRSEAREQMRRLSENIRVCFIAYTAALRFIDGGSKLPLKDSTEHQEEDTETDILNGLEEEAKQAGFQVHPDKLASIVSSYDIKTLRKLEGVDGLADKLNVSLDKGVNSSDVPTRQNVYGPNRYTEKPPKSFWMFVWEALHDLTLIILIVCAVVSIGVGIATEGFPKGMYDGVGIILSIFLVVMVTAVSDYKQSLQFKELDKEKKKISVQVIRDGTRQKVSIYDLVVGDVVHLSIGDQVPADGIFISGYNLLIDQSSLTGESVPINIYEKRPFLLSGTKVQDGSAKMLVTTVGMRTEWGKLMETLSEGGEDETPLQVKLNGVATIIGKIGLGFAMLTFLVLSVRFLVEKGVRHEFTVWSSSDATKLLLRLMCSYGGHIVPRPRDKSLFYAGGESRIVAVDRRTTAASLSSLSAHLSRAIFHNRPFHLKYQLPNEDLDSLISVITDEDLSNMLDENDRIAPPARIRLFLFPVKPESIGSALLDPKSESWFCDALKSTRILQKGQSADSGLLMGIGSDMEAPVESGSNSGGGGEGKNGAESVVLETSYSFGSTGSSFSMSNSPPIGVAHCDEKRLNLLDRKIMLPSLASIESDSSAGISATPSKSGNFQEPLIQVDPEDLSQNPISDHSINFKTQNTVQLLGYPLSQPPDGVKQRQETQLIQGNLQYMPQYGSPVPISPYYPVYQMPMHHQHITCPPNQPYPIYLVPMRHSQYNPNMSMQCNNPFDANPSSSSSRPLLHPQTAVITQTVSHKEVFGAQIAESATKVYCSVPAATQLVSNSIPSNQRQIVMAPPEPQIPSEPVTTAIEGSEFDEEIEYNLIYKTQPSPPVLPSQYQMMTKGTTMLSDPPAQLQPSHAKQQAALLPQ